MGDLLESGESALMIVAVNKRGSDITPLLPRAERSIVDDTVKGILEAAYDKAIAEAGV
jgi:hypothetical protein